jgi:AcrR family transcriptional regulator
MPGIINIDVNFCQSKPDGARMKSVTRQGKPAAAQMDESWSFSLVEMLRAQAAGAGSKSDRTLLKLKAGAAATLNAMPYQIMRVADIVKAAGVSHGLFYHYFKDKESITLELLAELVRASEQQYQNIHAPEDPYQGIYLANLYYINFYQKNAGLLRAALTLSDEVQAFRHLWNDAVDRWHKRIAHTIRTIAGEGGARVAGIDADLLAYSLGAMIDQICRQLFVQENPHLQQLTRDMRHLAEVLSIAWFRVTYARDPSAQQINSCRPAATTETLPNTAPAVTRRRGGGR